VRSSTRRRPSAGSSSRANPSGHVDQHVDTAEAHRDRSHRLPRPIDVGEIRAAEQQVPCPAELPLQIGGRLQHVDQGELGAGLAKGPRGRGTQRAERARNDDHRID
jgi:hypothetical protein